MARPNLLLCFDAFGTLFRPKRPVAQQYGEVARQCGITGFNDNELHSSLQAAIKDEAKRNPNYGKATGLGATIWWTNVVRKTFTPLIRSDQALPIDLAPRLLHRFSSDEGYDAEPNLVSTLKTLKHQSSQRRFNRIVIGVVTNSDDRVPTILSSFGVNVSPLRYGTEVNSGILSKQDYDVDFHCMSYDVGIEKPDKLIFDSAELMLTQILAIRDGKSLDEAKTDVEMWQKVYVGDEYAKDVAGAINAGWNPILLNADELSDGIPGLGDSQNQALADLFKGRSVIKVHSIEELAVWLMEGN